MEPFLIGDILKRIDGKLLSGTQNTIVECVSIDSRKIKKNCLFVPLVGKKTNAHSFINNVLNNGASAVLTQEKAIEYPESKTVIYVNNTLKALQNIALWYRRKFSLHVIGIAGSVGKTTTKDMVASVLSQKFKVMKTKKNFNSQIGLPLTILNLNKNYEIAVLELGISEPNEMIKLAQIALPNSAVITNIGSSHIENFKEKSEIYKEKLHITDVLNKNSSLFLNGDDEILLSAKNDVNNKIIYFGFNSNNDIKAANLKMFKNKTIFTFKNKNIEKQIVLNLPGKHNIYAALISIGTAVNFGLSFKEIQLGLNGYSGTPMRQQVYHLENLTLIDDSYNANPDSIKSAINTLEQVAGGHRKLVVLADVLELGDISDEEHYKLGVDLAQNNIDILLTVGEKAKNILAGLKNSGSKTKKMSFKNKEEAFSVLKNIISKDDTILVKGSRGMKMDKMVKMILNDVDKKSKQ
ncbi:MAG: UDP-N-acetylmuramoyl-tripeptide--D-alanyl-D-alanine ligase [Oscillospiraceae bacterium]|jgi:UDP-N-acetylmuramoyl-tripeptide--D-alanyl-D-alanine ligase|nr:UDP-N-acetylmuramoyl-tripeptide--D-alanyl-D-alanine ligase [Oscillospiraceae bacterium]